MDIDYASLGLTESEEESMRECLDILDEEELAEALAAPPRFCTSCGARINPVRVAMCADTTVCTEHAQAGFGQPAPVKAMMIYDHKTAGTLCFMEESVFNESKRLSDRKGNMSILRKVSPSKA